MSALPPHSPDAQTPLDRPGDPAPTKPFAPFSASNLFLDSQGLRPIWAIALFLFLWQLLRQVIFPFFQLLVPGAPPNPILIVPQAAISFEGAALLSVALATTVMAKIEQRPIAAYGFGPRHAPRNFLTGLACGAALLSLLVLALRASGLLVFDARLIFGLEIFRYAIVWFGGFLLVALAEETLLRGYLQCTLARGLSRIFRRLLRPAAADRAGFWTAAAVLSVVFGLGHRSNSGESSFGLLAAALAGLVFCFSLWRSGSLWWAIGFHAAWDWAQSFLYGVADSGLMVQGRLFATRPVGRPIFSGGLTGPEGSILLIPILVIAAAAIFVTLPRTTPATRIIDP